MSDLRSIFFSQNKICASPPPQILIVQRLHSSRKLLLSQIFHCCLLTEGSCSSLLCWVWAKESELFEYLPVRFPFASILFCQYICQYIVSRMYRPKIYKLFFPGLWSSCFYKLEEFWTSQMFGREAVLGEQQAGIPFGTVNCACAWGTPSLPEWKNWSNLFPAMFFVYPISN